jgi:hypothetical protein
MFRVTRNLDTLGPRLGDFPLGSIQSRAAARAIQLAQNLEIERQQAAQLRNLTPLEQMFSDSSDDREVQLAMVWTARHLLIPKHQIFGFDLPTPEKIRDLAKALEESKRAGLFGRQDRGRFSTLPLHD